MSSKREARRLLIIGFVAATWLIVSAYSVCAKDCDYDPQGKRDPFLSLVTPDGRLLRLEGENTAEQLKIEGIIYNEGGTSEAIINDAIVKVGDIVDGYRILGIEEDKVIFEKDGKTVSIGLQKEGE